MITKTKPCAVGVFTSKKNNKTYAKIWFPVESAYILGTPVESFIIEIDCNLQAGDVYNSEFLVAYNRGKILAVDFCS